MRTKMRAVRGKRYKNKKRNVINFFKEIWRPFHSGKNIPDKKDDDENVKGNMNNYATWPLQIKIEGGTQILLWNGCQTK